MIKTIIFDLGSVCFDIDWLKISEEMVSKYGVSTLVKSSGNKKLINLYNLTQEGKLDIVKFFKELCGDKVNYEEFMASYKQSYKNNKHPNKNLIELMKRLKGKVELVCLSDTNQVHWEAHQEQGSLNYFDKAFASFQIGGRKADKETFNKILKELEKKPEEILFIDDNEKNIDNAKSLGINVIKYKNSSQLIKDIKTFVSV